MLHVTTYYDRVSCFVFSSLSARPPRRHCGGSCRTRRQSELWHLLRAVARGRDDELPARMSMLDSAGLREEAHVCFQRAFRLLASRSTPGELGSSTLIMCVERIFEKSPRRQALPAWGRLHAVRRRTRICRLRQPQRLRRFEGGRFKTCTVRSPSDYGCTILWPISESLH